MIREIMKDPMFLAMKSEKAEKKDLDSARDLLDTLRAHRDTCVGMAANMIGVRKNIMAIDDHGMIMVMLNVVILDKNGIYETSEGCLSLPSVKKTKRYQKIKVRYQDMQMHVHTKEYTGRTAQIIQHEMDHIQGILI